MRLGSTIVSAFSILMISAWSTVAIPKSKEKIRITDEEHCSEFVNTDPDLAVQFCSAAIGSGRLSGENLASAFNNRGIAFSNKKDYQRAIQDYNEAIRIKPDFAEAFNNRGTTYYHRGNYNQAIQDYTKAISLDPDDPNPFNNRGIAYYEQGDCGRAIQDYNEAIRLKPGFEEALVNRGLAYKARADRESAKVTAAQAP